MKKSHEGEAGMFAGVDRELFLMGFAITVADLLLVLLPKTRDSAAFENINRMGVSDDIILIAIAVAAFGTLFASQKLGKNHVPDKDVNTNGE